MKIDDDIYETARQYVEAQLAIMERFGSRPDLSDFRLKMLISDCAKPAQRFRNQVKRERKIFRADAAPRREK